MKTKEELDLLMVDLCSRLPYGVKVYNTDSGIDPNVFSVVSINGFTKDVYLLRESDHKDTRLIDFSEVRPYLFPMSSMTEEQRAEFVDIGIREDLKYIDEPYKGEIRFSSESLQLAWLSKNHFDYRGLIPLGLAKDATGLGIY